MSQTRGFHSPRYICTTYTLIPHMCVCSGWRCRAPTIRRCGCGTSPAIAACAPLATTTALSTRSSSTPMAPASPPRAPTMSSRCVRVCRHHTLVPLPLTAFALPSVARSVPATRLLKTLRNANGTIASFCGSSCANNGEGALNTPDTLH